MYSKSLATAAALVSAFSVATAQTFTDCNPLDKTCPSDPALGVTLNTDFTQGKSSDWVLEAGTTLSYDKTGALFSISNVNQAPTIYLEPYILFGKITVSLKAAPGTGIVSSFILQSDDLDEIDWEWLGGNNAQVESNFFGKGNTTTYDRAIYHNVATPIDTFHTYTIDWTQDYIKWSIDGNLLRTLNYGDSIAVYGKNFPQTPMRVKMGNWVGCASVAAETDPKTQGTCQWAGGAVSFPGNYVMTVANVQVENYNCAQSYTYGDNSGSWQSIQKSGACGSPVNSTSPDTNSTSTASSSGSATGSATLSTSTTVSTVKPTGTATTTTGSPAKTSSATTTSSAPAKQSNSAGEALKFSTANVAVAAGIVGLGFLML